MGGQIYVILRPRHDSTSHHRPNTTEQPSVFAACVSSLVICGQIANGHIFFHSAVYFRGRVPAHWAKQIPSGLSGRLPRIRHKTHVSITQKSPAKRHTLPLPVCGARGLWPGLSESLLLGAASLNFVGANFLAGAWAFEVVVFRTCCNVTSRVRRKEEPALPYRFEWSCFGEHFRKTAILPYAVKKFVSVW